MLENKMKFKKKNCQKAKRKNKERKKIVNKRKLFLKDDVAFFAADVAIKFKQVNILFNFLILSMPTMQTVCHVIIFRWWLNCKDQIDCKLKIIEVKLIVIKM